MMSAPETPSTLAMSKSRSVSIPLLPCSTASKAPRERPDSSASCSWVSPFSIRSAWTRTPICLRRRSHAATRLGSCRSGAVGTRLVAPSTPRESVQLDEHYKSPMLRRGPTETAQGPDQPVEVVLCISALAPASAQDIPRLQHCVDGPPEPPCLPAWPKPWWLGRRLL